MNKFMYWTLVLVLICLFWVEIPTNKSAGSAINGNGFHIERMSHLPKEEGIWRFNHVVNGFNQMGYFICDKDGKVTTMFHHP